MNNKNTETITINKKDYERILEENFKINNEIFFLKKHVNILLYIVKYLHFLIGDIQCMNTVLYSNQFSYNLQDLISFPNLFYKDFIQTYYEHLKELKLNFFKMLEFVNYYDEQQVCKFEEQNLKLLNKFEKELKSNLDFLNENVLNVINANNFVINRKTCTLENKFFHFEFSKESIKMEFERDIDSLFFKYSKQLNNLDLNNFKHYLYAADLNLYLVKNVLSKFCYANWDGRALTATASYDEIISNVVKNFEEHVNIVCHELKLCAKDENFFLNIVKKEYLDLTDKNNTKSETLYNNLTLENLVKLKKENYESPNRSLSVKSFLFNFEKEINSYLKKNIQLCGSSLAYKNLVIENYKNYLYNGCKTYKNQCYMMHHVVDLYNSNYYEKQFKTVFEENILLREFIKALFLYPLTDENNNKNNVSKLNFQILVKLLEKIISLKK